MRVCSRELPGISVRGNRGQRRGSDVLGGCVSCHATTQSAEGRSATLPAVL